MKVLGTLIGVILFGQVASANVFTYQPLLVEQSKSGRFCPDLITANAVNERKSLRGQAVRLLDARGTSAVFTYTHTTRTCKEDILCESKNHYSQKSSSVQVTLKLKNDGAYPTTDLPGYSTLKLSWVDPQTSTSKYCYYMLR